MTCIAGLIDKETEDVWIGGDSAGVNGYYVLDTYKDRKVFRNGPFLFGFTTSFRMGDLLRYKFSAPYHSPNVPQSRYMVAEFIEAVRKCLSEGGFTTKKDEREAAGQFLVGYRSHLYYIDLDFQVAESQSPFNACGCAAEIARGVLCHLDQHGGELWTPKKRIRAALEAAERLSAGVRRPFVIRRLKASK